MMTWRCAVGGGYMQEVPARELNAKDTRGTAQSIFRRWLPLADAVLDMVVEVVPDPMAAQRRRIPALWPEHQEEEMLAQQQQQQDGAPPATNGHGGEEGQAGGMGELLAGMASVRSSLSCCSNGPDAPVVVFVSKMISVRNAELADSPAFSHEGESFVGFARVFSGVLRPNTQMHVLGPKYHPLRRRAASHCRAVPEDTRLCLYMMMGTSLTPVPHVPAGNLVAILGLDGLVLKSATLTSTLACPALTAMTLQVPHTSRHGDSPVPTEVDRSNGGWWDDGDLIYDSPLSVSVLGVSGSRPSRLCVWPWR